MMKQSWIFFMGMLTLGATPAFSAEYSLFPSSTGVGTVGDFTSIQEALDTAIDGDVITLAPGVYYANVVFPKTAITLQGEDPETTQMDGSLCLDEELGLAGCSVIRFIWDEDIPLEEAHPLITGLTITGGRGTETKEINPETTFAAQNGGGIALYKASPDLSNLVVKLNTASYGGGISLWEADPEMSDVVVRRNTATANGGGLDVLYSEPVMHDVSISDNISTVNGGGLDVFASVLTLWDVDISGNRSVVNGGGLNISSSEGSLVRATLNDNFAGDFGGGLMLTASSFVISNAHFHGNSAGDEGGAIRLGSSELHLVNATVSTNTAGQRGGGMDVNASNAYVSNSIFAYNEAGESPNVEENSGTVTSNYNLFYDRSTGTSGTVGFELNLTDIVTNPGFYNDIVDGNKSNNDLHLVATSPALNAGDPSDNCLNTDTWELDWPCDNLDGSTNQMGAFGGPYQLDTDNDQDGLADSWEIGFGLSDELDDSGDDLDEDGLSNAEEFHLKLNPSLSDTDGDGLSDGDEIIAGTNPHDLNSPILHEDEPNVVYVPEDAALISSAIAHSRDGTIIRVAPGTYTDSLWLHARQLEIQGLGGSDETTLESDSTSPGLQAYGLKEGSYIGGLAFTKGNSDKGGGLFVLNSVGTFTDLNLLNNTATDVGGGAYFHSSPITLNSIKASLNFAGFRGGGLYLDSSPSKITNSKIDDNTSGLSGAGLYLKDSDTEILGTIITNNTSGQSGGGIYLDQSDSVLSNLLVAANRADGSAGGGGIFVNYSAPAITNCTISGNSAYGGPGGGLEMFAGSPVLANNILALNQAETAKNMHTTSDDFEHTHNLYYDAITSDAGVAGITLGETELNANPLFYDDATDGITSDDDYHLRPESPAINAGDPEDHCYDAETQSHTASCIDPDGTRNDMGMFGGPFSTSTDADGDGLPDDWEQKHDLDTTSDDSQADIDGDGLSNLEEFAASTDPNNEDSDFDGLSDGEEIDSGTSPLDLSDPGPHGEEPRVIYVPDDVASIKDAVSLVLDGAIIKVRPGVYNEQVEIFTLDIKLIGLGGPSETIIDANKGGTALTVSGTPEGLEVSGFTLKDGRADFGGGLLALGASGSLSNLEIRGNDAESGGGVYISESNIRLSQTTIQANNADDQGGGIYCRRDNSSFDNVTIIGNATRTLGGGAFFNVSDANFRHTTFINNTADFHGGAIYDVASRVAMSNVSFEGNETYLDGGAVYLNTSTSTFVNAVLSGNTASESGGAFYLLDSQPVIHNSIIAFNEAEEGASIYSENSEVLSAYNLFYSTDSALEFVAFETSVTDLIADPLFVVDPLNEEGLDSDYHLQETSPAINSGDLEPNCRSLQSPELTSACSDPDASQNDRGIYGGAIGDQWNLDGDNHTNYFWPADYELAPSGFSSTDYDCLDTDEDTYPDADELLDNTDNDCDGIIDEEGSVGCDTRRGNGSNPMPALALGLLALGLHRRRQ